MSLCLFFLCYTGTTEIQTYSPPLALLDALPIYLRSHQVKGEVAAPRPKSFAIESTRFLSRLPTLICQLGQDDSDEAEPTAAGQPTGPPAVRSEEHTSELQSLMRISYAVFCMKKKTTSTTKSDTKNRKNNE